MNQSNGSDSGFHPYKRQYRSIAKNRRQQRVIKRIRDTIKKDSTMDKQEIFNKTSRIIGPNIDTPTATATATATAGSLFSKTPTSTDTSKSLNTFFTETPTPFEKTTPPTPNVNNLFKDFSFTNPQNQTTQTTLPVSTNHTQTGFSFDSPTVKSLYNPENIHTHIKDKTKTFTKDTTYPDFTLAYITTLEENNRFLRQIQNGQRRANFQHREYLRLQKKIEDLQLENDNLKEIIESRENECENTRTLLSQANNSLRSKDKIIFEWNRWYECHDDLGENNVECEEEYIHKSEDVVEEIESLPKNVNPDYKQQPSYEDALKEVSESVAKSVLEDISRDDILPNINVTINQQEPSRWCDIVDEDDYEKIDFRYT